MGVSAAALTALRPRIAVSLLHVACTSTAMVTATLKILMQLMDVSAIVSTVGLVMLAVSLQSAPESIVISTERQRTWTGPMAVSASVKMVGLAQIATFLRHAMLAETAADMAALKTQTDLTAVIARAEEAGLVRSAKTLHCVVQRDIVPDTAQQVEPFQKAVTAAAILATPVKSVAFLLLATQSHTAALMVSPWTWMPQMAASALAKQVTLVRTVPFLLLAPMKSTAAVMARQMTLTAQTDANASVLEVSQVKIAAHHLAVVQGSIVLGMEAQMTWTAQMAAHASVARAGVDQAAMYHHLAKQRRTAADTAPQLIPISWMVVIVPARMATKASIAIALQCAMRRLIAVAMARLRTSTSKMAASALALRDLDGLVLTAVSGRPAVPTNIAMVMEQPLMMMQLTDATVSAPMAGVDLGAPRHQDVA